MCSPHLKETIRYLTEQAELAMTRAKELTMLNANRAAFDNTLKDLVDSTEATYLALHQLHREISGSNVESSGTKSETVSSGETPMESDDPSCG